MSWFEMRASRDRYESVGAQHWPRLPDVMLHDIKGDRAELGLALQRQDGFSAPHAETAMCEFDEDVRWPGEVK